MSEVIVEKIEQYGSNSKGGQQTLFSKIGVIGCGKEGQNIARISAYFGLDVVFLELTNTKIELALEGISRELDQRIETWGLTESEKKSIMSRINGTLKYEDLVDCDFVIEAIRSDEVAADRSIEKRKEIFCNVERFVRPDCIIATNATTVIITELASELIHKERCVSLHFFLTSPEARIIEVVKGLYTTDDVYFRVCQFVKLVNREVIPVHESAGLISVRLFIVLLNEACDLILEGVATAEHINKTTKVGFGYRFGIFHDADIVGLDKVMRWGENLFEEFGDSRYKPSPLIKRLVRAKRTGVSVGEGFFKYDEQGKLIVEPIPAK